MLSGKNNVRRNDRSRVGLVSELLYSLVLNLGFGPDLLLCNINLPDLSLFTTEATGWITCNGGLPVWVHSKKKMTGEIKKEHLKGICHPNTQ